MLLNQTYKKNPQQYFSIRVETYAGIVYCYFFVVFCKKNRHLFAFIHITYYIWKFIFKCIFSYHSECWGEIIWDVVRSRRSAYFRNKFKLIIIMNIVFNLILGSRTFWLLKTRAKLLRKLPWKTLFVIRLLRANT